MENVSPDYSYRALFKDVWRFVKPYRGRFLFGTFLRASSDMVYVYATYALAEAIAFFTDYSSGDSLDVFWRFFWAWAISATYVMIVRQFAKYICYRIAEKTRLDSHLQAIDHLTKLDMSWHEKENAGNKLKKIYNAGDALDKIVRVWTDNIIQISIFFVSMIIIIARIDIRIGMIMLVFLITHLMISVPLGRRAGTAARKVSQHEEDLGGLIYEVLNNIRSVKVMGMFGGILPLFHEKSQKIFDAVTARVFRFRSKSAIEQLWSHIFRIGCTIMLIYGIISGHYEVNFLILFNFYFTNLRTSVEELSDVSQEFTIARYRMERLNDIFSEKIIIDDNTGKCEMPNNWKLISLRNISFSYGNHKVLDSVSFDIKRGEKIGIVGLSGAGKSTLFKLLLKEYENFTGDISFDSVSIRAIKRSSYFAKAAVVLQDTEVFDFSLKDNIIISNPDSAKNTALLKMAVDTAHVADFMSKLPNGLDTLIGEKGIKLSGGERQRVGIARAIFRKPEIFFMDEATSHLDLESEEKIRDSFTHFFQNVTAIVIAHRLTTIQKMDRILLFEDGRLLEQGSFDALMKEKGRFFELWQKQKF